MKSEGLRAHVHRVVHISCSPLGRLDERSLLFPSPSSRTASPALGPPCCCHVQMSTTTPRLVRNVPPAAATQSPGDETCVGERRCVAYSSGLLAQSAADSSTDVFVRFSFSSVRRAARWMRWFRTAVWVVPCCSNCCSPPFALATPPLQRTPPRTPERPQPGHTSPLLRSPECCCSRLSAPPRCICAGSRWCPVLATDGSPCCGQQACLSP